MISVILRDDVSCHNPMNDLTLAVTKNDKLAEEEGKEGLRSLRYSFHIASPRIGLP